MLQVLANGSGRAQPRLASDADDHRVGDLFLALFGREGLEEAVRALQCIWRARLRDDQIGNLIRLFLERRKAAHRTRAEGYAAAVILLEMCQSQIGILLDASCRAWVVDKFIGIQAPKLRSHLGCARGVWWDAPQLLRSLAKRAGMACCFDEATMRALICFPKCFYGMLAALTDDDRALYSIGREVK